MENNNEMRTNVPPPITASQQPDIPPALSATSQVDLSKFDKYYQEEFRKIIESNEKYKGKWNWWAFLTSWAWCFSKGCWGYGLLTIVSIVLSSFGNFYLFVVIGWSVILGLRGTWLLYNVKFKQKQFPKSLF